jgi:Zn-dependent protease with chaperone function/tetratricopeptide (TPR) repeat protein
MSTPAIEPPVDRPLSGAAKAALICGAAATIILFYLFAACTLVGLLIWVGLLLIVALAAVRFGAVRVIAPYLERDVKLLGLLAKSLWLRRGATFRLQLKPEEAPGIVAIMQRLCGRLQIPLPDAIFLEMNAGAWVELKGIKQNLGKTHLGIGYDLLAGLTEQEIEAVLAHELVHAKLIYRAFKNWLKAGLFRAATLSNQPSATAGAYRRAGKSFTIAEMILRVSDSLTRWCARFVAAYSRQDEFEADHGAAELCGSAPLRSSLQKLEILADRLARLPWNERVAQIQSDEGLSHWLVQELAPDAPASQSGDAPHIFNRYSTHPAMRDRLAALPDDGSQLHESTPAIGLLADPDAVARKLVGEIERLLFDQENQDLKGLRQWLRKTRRGARVRPAQWPGLIIGIGVCLCSVVAVGVGSWLVALLSAGLGLPLAIFLYRIGHYRDRHALPVPDYASLKAVWSDPKEIKDIEAVQKQLQKELRDKLAQEKRKSRKLSLMVSETYQALARCDYLRAHVASRLCIEIDNKSVEGSLALSIASAAHHQADQSNRSLQTVLRNTALRSPSTAWGAAWALTLSGAWMPAEALLHEGMKNRPGDPTFLALLALCQSRRGKLQNALANARLTCTPKPASAEHAKLLIRLLLDRGDLNEAAQWLRQLEKETHEDRELQFSIIRLHLLRREFAAADEWIQHVTAQEVPPHLFVELGGLYERARNDSKAVEFYQRALTAGYLPEALLGLARQAAQAGDNAQARKHILAALDVTMPLGKKARSAFDLFSGALAQLWALNEPAADCKAWIIGFLAGTKAGPLTRRSLFVYAHNEREASGYLRTIMQAMEPNNPLMSAIHFNIKEAPKDLQPAQPVRPGVQHLYN